MLQKVLDGITLLLDTLVVASRTFGESHTPVMVTT
jgi:hypothetical protein